MGYVTDGGLEPEPVASIKGAAGVVNGILALFGEIFGDFGRSWGNLAAADARSGGVSVIAVAASALTAVLKPEPATLSSKAAWSSSSSLSPALMMP